MKERFIADGGSDMNTPFMVGLITEQSKPMIRQLDMLETRYSNQAAALETASSNARTEFEAQQYARDNKLKVYQMMLDMLGTKAANEAAAAQQQFDNEMKIATLNKPRSVSKYGDYDPITGQLIPGSRATNV